METSQNNFSDRLTAIVEKFNKNLTDKEKNEYQLTTLQDLQVAIDKIQRQHASSRTLQGMRRLQTFLKSMEKYEEVIKIVANTSTILAFVWVGMKKVQTTLQLTISTCRAQ